MTDDEYDEPFARRQRTLRVILAVVAGVAALGMILPLLASVA